MIIKLLMFIFTMVIRVSWFYHCHSQAHVRGHQARKNYEAICWAVGIVDKIILRWHRKRVGLRGFHLDSIDESADEDIAKLFRKQRVDVALAEAVSRVLSMVNSTPARQQYRRMLQKYQQAKVSNLYLIHSNLCFSFVVKWMGWVNGLRSID